MKNLTRRWWLATAAAVATGASGQAAVRWPGGRGARRGTPGLSTDQNYLYVVANGLSQIVGNQVGADGSLTQVTTAPVAAGSVGLGAS